MVPTMHLRFTISEGGNRILQQWWHYSNDYSGEWIVIDFNPTEIWRQMKNSNDTPVGYIPCDLSTLDYLNKSINRFAKSYLKSKTEFGRYPK